MSDSEMIAGAVNAALFIAFGWHIASGEAGPVAWAFFAFWTMMLMVLVGKLTATGGGKLPSAKALRDFPDVTDEGLAEMRRLVADDVDKEEWEPVDDMKRAAAR